MKHIKPIPKRLAVFLTLALALFIGQSVALAQEGPRLEITKVDISNFPTINLNVIASESDSQRTRDLSSLRLSEGTTAIADFDVDDVPVGVEMIFVIDANETINERDSSGDITRLEKVRESIIRYADRFMDEAQLDRVTIVVPGQGGGRVLLEGAQFRNEVINEINFYVPEVTGDTPLGEMMNRALELAEQSRDSGRFQAILLFTDGAQIGRQIDYPSVVEKAQSLSVPIFSAILGRSADPNEVENVSGLADPTRGSYVHMPESDEADLLYALAQEHGLQHRISYQSSLNTAGTHSITVASAGARSSVDIDLDIQPPLVELPIDASQPIRRVATDPNAPLTSAQPARQPLVVAVSWPDGNPREIDQLTLTVNSLALPSIDSPSIGPSGLIDLDWDISNLDSGSYELVVLVTDNLGLQGQSDLVRLNIVVEGLGGEPPETSSGEVRQETGDEPVAGGVSEPESADDELNLVAIGIAVFALLAALGAIILAVFLVRRRRPVEAAPVAAPAATSAGDLEHDATQVILPAFAAMSSAGAYLEPVDNAPDHSDSIPITSDNLAIGRDPKLSQVVFADKSVSRLHARIMQSGGQYMLYDEGSASGTYINYNQVSLTPQPLSDNDDVHIGRVHLRFHLIAAPAGDDDATQIMPGPQAPGQPAPPAPAPADDDMSTQPYMPHQPPAPGPAPGPAPDQGGQDNDEDDISTQPYMPHSPRR